MTLTGVPPKKTKIVCTIGPASESVEVLEQMVRNGMDIARINFAHGDFDRHRQVIQNVRTAAANTGQRVAIFGDLPGPKMRIGELAMETVNLERGQEFVLQTEPIVGDEHRVSTSFERLCSVVHPGDSIYLNDGLIELRVEEVLDKEARCWVRVGGELRSHKGLNLPGLDLGISAHTEFDGECLRFAAAQHLDGVSQSFVETASDIETVRAAATALDYKPFIIAKIERAGALDHLEAILEASDGIMVARGDLGVEIAIERVAEVQKQIIGLANLRGTPVITATHMLESMTTTRRPTRAEVADVANAIEDGSDAVMLSGETAVGRYPEVAVETMAKIAAVTEHSRRVYSGGVAEKLEWQRIEGNISVGDLISLQVQYSAKMLDPEAVFVPSASGATARRLTRFRLKQWIIAPSFEEATCQRLQFSFGVYPVHISRNPLSWPHFAHEWLEKHGAGGKLALVVEGGGTLQEGDMVRIDIINPN